MSAYPPPPPAYTGPPPAYGQQQQNTTVVIGQPTYGIVQHFREISVRTTCPGCRSDVYTSVHYEVGTFTWIACIVIMLIGFWIGCCLIPFCINGCKDAVHTCPNCRHVIGFYKRM